MSGSSGLEYANQNRLNVLLNKEESIKGRFRKSSGSVFFVKKAGLTAF